MTGGLLDREIAFLDALRAAGVPVALSEVLDATRAMGAVELLSREGEIAIAKRIEAGREAMIAGLCESPLTFQAVIIWREELNNAKIFLRDIIDLEATYAGPDAKQPQVAGGEAPPGTRRTYGRVH